VVAARLGAAFALGSAAFSLCSQPGLHAVLGPAAVPVLALAAGNNLVFWLFARALFDDGFRLRAWQGVAWAAIVATALACGLVLQPQASPAAGPVHAALGFESLAFALAAAAQTLGSWRDDLVEPRRRLRLFVVIAAAGLSVASNLGVLLLPTPSPGAALLQAAALAAIAAVVTWSLTRISGGEALFALPGAPEPVQAAPAGLSPADVRLADALARRMADERLYRQDGLTIGRLAHLQDVPEYRLRRVINQGLGQRNFAAWLNGYRIAEAMAALADASQDEVPILTIALDAGFASLGPFNRAFKAETGMTPTEYRRNASPLSRATSRISKPARREAATSL
jgi:AraC-like DNA-binding protein